MKLKKQKFGGGGGGGGGGNGGGNVKGCVTRKKGEKDRGVKASNL